MSKHFREEFEISVTPEAIQKTLKTANMTWKTVNQILCKWNKATFLQQQHNYVLNQVTNDGHKLIFLNESGFNFQIHPSHGYLLTGHAATLKTKSKGRLIKLIGAMAEGVPPRTTSSTSSSPFKTTTTLDLSS
ncbi:hypothetical protein VP01_8714g1 [Puccinia sorghi]|uniref:Uncharacterized protein n=1 Tax=Puccinia sorghi TaxID=27349 RepID=A0A0L6U8N4_9BASI|nr:hypothetical protein VP01_8714g1 [Puccinia sorghi]